MRIFTFKYEKNPIKSGLARMKKAVNTGVPHVREHEMICGSSEIMNKVMSTARLDLFVAIVEQRPESLYELAQMLEKDQSQVLKDARTLESLKLIKLSPNADGGREKLKPEPLYDKIVFEVEPKKMAESA